MFFWFAMIVDMDTVVLDGVQYVKASAAAKQFRYTSDYVGQLCRSKKIDARLVGRTWFVNPDSLSAYKKQKHEKSSTASSDTETKHNTADHTESKTGKTSVEPVVGAKTAKHAVQSAPTKPNETRSLKVQYEADEEELFPTIRKRQPPKRLQIEYADSKKVKIDRNRTRTTQFRPDELPDVALSGKLDVSTATETDPDKADDITKENKDISDTPKKDPESEESTRHIKTKLKGKATLPIPVHVFEGSVAPPALHREAAASPHRVVSLQPSVDAAVTPATTFTPRTVQPVQEASLLVRISPLIATLCAAVIVFCLFASSSYIVVTESGYDSQILFRTANMLQLMQW